MCFSWMKSLRQGTIETISIDHDKGKAKGIPQGVPEITTGGMKFGSLNQEYFQTSESLM